MSVWDTCLQITVACTLVGAWVGALPIPLDWDRPWQVSPAPLMLILWALRWYTVQAGDGWGPQTDSESF